MRHSLQGSAAWLLCATAVLLLCAVPAIAADTTSEAVPTPNSHVSETAVEAAQIPVLDLSGFLAFIDPETGEFRAPNEQEAAALAQALRLPQQALQARSLQAPTVESVTLDNGVAAESVLLDLSSVSFSVARVQADGSVAFDCGIDHDHSAHTATATDTNTAQPGEM